MFASKPGLSIGQEVEEGMNHIWQTNAGSCDNGIPCFFENISKETLQRP